MYLGARFCVDKIASGAHAAGGGSRGEGEGRVRGEGRSLESGRARSDRGGGGRGEISGNKIENKSVHPVTGARNEMRPSVWHGDRFEKVRQKADQNKGPKRTSFLGQN